MAFPSWGKPVSLSMAGLEEGSGLGSGRARSSSTSLTRCATWGKSVNFTVPQFPHPVNCD